MKITLWDICDITKSHMVITLWETPTARRKTILAQSIISYSNDKIGIQYNDFGKYVEYQQGKDYKWFSVNFYK